VFEYIFVVVTSLSFVYFCLKPNERIDIPDTIKEKEIQQKS
jgi:hypothetical protein